MMCTCSWDRRLRASVENGNLRVGRAIRPARLGFVGHGSIARFHAQILQAEGAILDTVVGIQPAERLEFAKEFGFGKHTDDFDRALAAPEIDAFVIASPSPLH